MSPAPSVKPSPIEHVLDLARWAPSGDNTQPWRFEILSPSAAVIHAFDTRRHCVYDLTGGPSQIAVGAMLETARLAASSIGMRAGVKNLPTDSDERLQFRLDLFPDAAVACSELVQYIQTRCTNRRPYSSRPLGQRERDAIEGSVGADLHVRWLEGPQRRAAARLLFESAKIRLTIPEAYTVHRDVIEWNAQFSESRIPDQAVGLDPVGMALMRWAMKSWERTSLLSNYLGGTLLPRIQLELLPALGCAAHLVLVGRAPLASIEDNLLVGAAVQRLWLTATQHDLQMQPELTPLIFAGYSRHKLEFSADRRASARAARLSALLDALLGKDIAERAVWLCRVGFANSPQSRSTRLPLERLRQV